MEQLAKARGGVIVCGMTRAGVSSYTRRVYHKAKPVKKASLHLFVSVVMNRCLAYYQVEDPIAGFALMLVMAHGGILQVPVFNLFVF